MNAIYAVLREKLRATTCEAFTADLRIKVPQAAPFRYPDVSVACEAQFEEIPSVQALLNPVLLIEALSVSTTDYDLGAKFTAYQSSASFQEYLVITQDRPHVIQHVRQPKGWLRLDLIGLESVARLESLQLELSLREIYERVSFPTEAA